MNISYTDKQKMSGYLIAIFLGAFLIRILLALVNAEANDHHLGIVNLINRAFTTGYFPDKFYTCRECFHPKLYHFICSAIFRLLSISEQDEASKYMTAQLISVFFSGISLWTIALLISERLSNATIGKFLYLLIAFNPEYVAVSIQVTNDSMAIALGGLTFYFFSQFILQKYYTHLILACLSLFLGLLTKGNLMIYFPIIILTSLYSVFANNTVQSLKCFIITLIALVVTMSALILSPKSIGDYSHYFSKFHNKHKISVVHYEPAGLPDFFHKTTVRRPGIQSIFSGYFTFRLIDMLRAPRVSHKLEITEMHRTSYFSQLYGRYNSIFFPQWPWQRDPDWTDWLTRASLILGLTPILALLVGIYATLLKSLRILPEHTSHFFNLAVVLGFQAMLIFFTLEYRGFDSIKPLYLYPGIFAIPLLQATGITFLKDKFSFLNNKSIKELLYANCYLWFFINFVSYLVLFEQLW